MSPTGTVVVIHFPRCSAVEVDMDTVLDPLAVSTECELLNGRPRAVDDRRRMDVLGTESSFHSELLANYKSLHSHSATYILYKIKRNCWYLCAHEKVLKGKL